MGDLTEDEIQTWLSTKPPHLGDTMRDLYRLLDEVRRHRAAQAATAERVRSVVRTACLELLMFDEGVEAGQIEQIATRAADQLATLTDIGRQRASLAARAGHVRDAVREAFSAVAQLSAHSCPQRVVEDVATRVAEQLATPDDTSCAVVASDAARALEEHGRRADERVRAAFMEGAEWGIENSEQDRPLLSDIESAADTHLVDTRIVASGAGQ